MPVFWDLRIRMPAAMKTANFEKTKNAQIKTLLVVLAAISWLLEHNVETRILLHVKKRLCVLESKRNALPVDPWPMDQNVLKEENAAKDNVYHIVRPKNSNHVCVTPNKMLANDVAERISIPLASQS